jgi:excisionase family DNA binding protein
MNARLYRFPSPATADTTADQPDDTPYTGPVPVFDPDATTYTVEQVAYLISLSADVTREWAEDGTIPAVRTGNGWEIPRKRFTEWIDSLPTDGGAL